MHSEILFRLALAVMVTAALPAVAEEPPNSKKIVLIAGPKSHGPDGNGIHDYAWSVRLLKALLERSSLSPQLRVEAHVNGWPANEQSLENADTIMIVSDGRDGDKYEEALHLASPERVATVERQMKRGCGFVTFHFSTFAPDQYAEQMLRWSGAYFDWEHEGKREWYSVIKTLEASVTLPNPEHPIARGVKAFRLREEFYFNLRFAPEDRALTPLLEARDLGGREPHGNVVAWARQREDGGRAFGTTCGHFYENWRNDDLRKLVLNALIWTARLEVPPAGLESRFAEREELSNLSTSSAGR